MILLLGPLVPLVLLLAMAAPARREQVFGLLWLAPLPALGLALLGPSLGPLVLDAEGLRLTLALDAPGALLLGAAALLWSGAGAYARDYLAGAPNRHGFAAWWLVTLSGSLGVFFAGDLASFYLFFAMASLAGFGLVVQEGNERAVRAGALYLLLAVLGELALLLGFALLAVAAPTASLALADVVPPLAGTRGGDVTALLLVIGFGIKMGLVPLHVWLPVAHPAAPIPASAVLSGAILKAGVIGLLRFLPAEAEPWGWGTVLAALGFLTAYWGVAVGLTQRDPKTVLAYSSVSQMGVVAAVIGMGLALSVEGSALHAAFYATHHVLAKGALFLAVGVALAMGPSGRLFVLPLALLLALSFGGLAPSGGAAAKAAVKGELGAGLAATAAAVSAAGSTMLMLHFVHRLAIAAREAAPGPARPGLLLPWLALGLAALGLPWLLFPESAAAARGKAWSAEAFLPVLVGAALAAAWWRWGRHVPPLPEGDVLVLARRSSGPRRAIGRAVERCEAALRAWPVAGLALLGVVLALLAAMGALRPPG